MRIKTKTTTISQKLKKQVIFSSILPFNVYPPHLHVSISTLPILTLDPPEKAMIEFEEGKVAAEKKKKDALKGMTSSTQSLCIQIPNKL